MACWRSTCFTCAAARVLDRREFFWEDLPEFEPAVDGNSGGRLPACRFDVRQSNGTSELCPPDSERKRSRRFRSRRVLLLPAQTALHRPALCAAEHLRAGRLRGPRESGRTAIRATGGRRCSRHPRPYRRPAARRQALAHRPGRQQRQAILRPALPRDEAQHEGHPGSLAGRAWPARAPAAHRVLRHLAHSGSGDRRLHGGVGRRPDEEVRLPQVHHRTVEGVDDFASMREVVTRRYKRIAGRRQKNNAQPDSDRRRPRPTARRGAKRWRRSRSSTSRWPPSPSAKRSSTSTDRKTNRSRSTTTRPCCIWCS